MNQSTQYEETELNNAITEVRSRTVLRVGFAATAALAAQSILRAQGTGRIGFAMETFTVPRWKNLDKPSFESAVEAGGYEPVVVQANFDVAQQLRDVTIPLRPVDDFNVTRDNLAECFAQ